MTTELTSIKRKPLTKLKSLSGLTILIVEDDKMILRVYTKWLTRSGAVVATAYDGVQCLKILDEEKIDLVLLDLGMPGLNGYDTLTLLRQKPEYVQLPVIVISNTAESENSEGFNDVRKAGVKYVLRKYETSLKEIVQCICSYFPGGTS